MRRESVPQYGAPPCPQAQQLQGALVVENVRDGPLQALAARSMVCAGTGGDTAEMMRGLWAAPARQDHTLLSQGWETLKSPPLSSSATEKLNSPTSNHSLTCYSPSFTLSVDRTQDVCKLAPKSTAVSYSEVKLLSPAWRIAWTEEPGGLQSLRLQRVQHH